MVENSPATDVFTQLTPALHGLYRAVSSTPFNWTIAQWAEITKHFNAVCAPDIVDRLSHLLASVVHLEEKDPNAHQFVSTFLSRYVGRGRPLSGYFIVCCIMETEWTILAQVLAPPQQTSPGAFNFTEAAAANKAWNSLMRQPAVKPDLTSEQDTVVTLKETVANAMHCFTDLLVQIEDMEAEPSLDTYTWETMSESLVGFLIDHDRDFTIC